jgi:hypothetical protein
MEAADAPIVDRVDLNRARVVEDHRAELFDGQQIGAGDVEVVLEQILPRLVSLCAQHQNVRWCTVFMRV